MKNYKKEVEAPRLVIKYDDSPESPREWDNLGYFITVDRKYNSPDDHGDFMEVIKETGEEATSQAEHMEMIKKEIESRFNGENVMAIYPVVKYEHSNIVYRLGTVHGFDYSNNGFYIVTEKSAKKIGTDPKDFEAVIKSELETYNKWANGEVYGFVLYDEDGEVEDSCGGFYSLEDIKEQLPEEWKDEDLTDYIK